MKRTSNEEDGGKKVSNISLLYASPQSVKRRCVSPRSVGLQVGGTGGGAAQSVGNSTTDRTPLAAPSLLNLSVFVSIFLKFHQLIQDDPGKSLFN